VTLTFGSAFAGIGGFDLGREQAGFETRWQIEIDPFRRAVLAHHWPDVPRHADIREVRTDALETVDLVCGGFPCEDISRAGRRAGIGGAKSGLWSELHRITRDLRPGYLLLENSTSLLVRGLGRVLGDLAEIGYDAEWDCLPAAAFGAPHIRDRLYLLAYPRERRHRTPQATVFAGWSRAQLHGGWSREPAIPRMADGLPGLVDRRAALGDAVVPSVVAWIGERIAADALSCAYCGDTGEAYDPLDGDGPECPACSLTQGAAS
jgi:DNA (cytosine-5)-methyltransferase 1